MKHAGKIIAFVLIVVFTAALLGACSGNDSKRIASPEDAAFAFINCLHKTYKYEDLVEMAPQEYVEAFLEQNELTREELVNGLKAWAKDCKETNDLGWLKSIEVTGVEEANASYLDTFDKQLDGIVISYDEAKEVSVTNHSEDGHPGWTDSVYVIKIDGKWYVHPCYFRNNGFLWTVNNINRD